MAAYRTRPVSGSVQQCVPVVVGGGALRLEHLRFGPDRPVLLLELAPGVDGRWRELSPHECREDCYSASLTIDSGQLVVAWSIEGPRKRESIRYTYW